MPEPLPGSGMTDAQRRRYKALRRRFSTLSGLDRLEYERLHEEAVNEAWRAAPFFDPLGLWVFEPPPLVPRRGRPKGVSTDIFDELCRCVATFDGPTPPSEQMVAELMHRDVRWVQKIVSRT